MISAATKFSISLSCNKIKFFRNANKILSKIGTANMPVLMKLNESFCISALLFNLEIFDLNKSSLNTLNFALFRMYMKIYKTNNLDALNTCLFYFGQLPIDLVLMLRKLKHLNLLLEKSDNILYCSLSDVIWADRIKLLEQWVSLGDGLVCPSKREAWTIFANRLNTCNV